MNKFVCAMIILFLSIIPNTIIASSKIKVLVMPFEINSVEDRSYLKTKISDLISEHLKNEGAEILPSFSESDIVIKDKPTAVESFRKIGLDRGAEYIIWGSMTWAGQKYSIDVNLAEIAGSGSPLFLFRQGENVENLFGNVREIAKNLSARIFRQVNIAKIIIAGNRRIDTDAIKRLIKTMPGDVFSSQKLAEDLKAVYSMGYFEDVRIESEEGPDGKAITFLVKEKPTVRNIKVSGGKELKEDEIKKDLTITTGSVLNIFKLQSNIKIIESLYKEKNYHNIKVTYKIKEIENNQADIEFVIEEGEKLRITKIKFEGNSNYSDKKLKKIIKTSEKGLFSWITSSGEYSQENIEQDVQRLTSFYLNTGYMQVRVSDPDVEIKGKDITLTFKISEGQRFKMGKVDISGDILFPKEEMLKKMKISEEEFFNRQVIQQDILQLTDLCSDEGYANAEINPIMDQDMKNKSVNISYNIKKGDKVYFEKIMISGNTKTRDKVVRRELMVNENELFSGKMLKRSVKNLYRLDFFEDIKVDKTKGSAENLMNLDIKVKEKSTGAFTFGGGYSSVENLFALVSFSQRNLFGRGQETEIKAEVGGTTTRYSLSFTEPWLFNIPLTAGADLYNWIVDYDEYDKDSKGGAVRFGYPVFDYTRAYFSYAYDVSDISDISYDAADEIKDLEGTNTTSMVSSTLKYDSRDRIFNPTEGSNHSVTVEFAGLGGNIGYIKYLAETGWYLPFYKEIVIFLHAKTGYIHKNSGKKVPDYERFYLGGMNSVRGFDWRDISSYDEKGASIGGDKFIQSNVELLFPILKEAGFMGVVFYDIGNVYSGSEDIDLMDLRKSAGFGLRWYSPMGPMRIEYGYILDPIEGQGKGGRWEFSIGQAF